MKEKKQSRRAGKPAAKPKAMPPKTEEAAKPSPATNIEDGVNMILIDAVRKGADAVHVEPGPKGLTIRFRVDGVLRPAAAPEPDLQEALQGLLDGQGAEEVIPRLKKMSRMRTDDERVPKDGRFGAIIDGREIDFRVHSVPACYGESLTLRLLDRATLIKMDKLGFSAAALTKVRGMMDKPRGLVLVAGPAGSGKTTTLYAMLSEMGKSDKKVVSIEYPIEFNLANVTQSQIDPRLGYDYATALSLVARQDPDVVMVGELGDADTARAALQTALGGHLVLSSIHANDAAEAIGRLLGMGIDPLLVATGLEGVLAQRLARRVCPACRQSYAPNKTQSMAMGLRPGQKLADKGRGCKECKGTGYKGHVGVFAVMPVTDELRDLVLARPQPGDLRRSMDQIEKAALNKDGMEKVKAGLITVEESVRIGQA